MRMIKVRSLLTLCRKLNVCGGSGGSHSERGVDSLCNCSHERRSVRALGGEEEIEEG